MPATSLLEQAVRYDQKGGEHARRQRHVLYVVATSVLTLIVVSAVVDSASKLPMYGIEAHTSRAESNGIELAVTYPRVVRGQLDSTMTVSIRKAGGFPGPVTLSVSAGYLGLFVNQRVTPDPSSQSQDEDNLVSTFDAPEGDTLVVDWDLAARPRPFFIRKEAVAAVLDDQQQTIVSVRFRTDVRP